MLTFNEKNLTGADRIHLDIDCLCRAVQKVFYAQCYEPVSLLDVLNIIHCDMSVQLTAMGRCNGA